MTRYVVAVYLPAPDGRWCDRLAIPRDDVTTPWAWAHLPGMSVRTFDPRYETTVDRLCEHFRGGALSPPCDCRARAPAVRPRRATSPLAVLGALGAACRPAAEGFTWNVHTGARGKTMRPPIR